jgi:hypothetical protein
VQEGSFSNSTGYLQQPILLNNWLTNGQYQLWLVTPEKEQITIPIQLQLK